MVLVSCARQGERPRPGRGAGGGEAALSCPHMLRDPHYPDKDDVPCHIRIAIPSHRLRALVNKRHRFPAREMPSPAILRRAFLFTRR